MRNPKWHRDEIILALDLYHDPERGTIDSGNPKIISLSKLLNKLPIFEHKPDEQTFRNANGVTLKLSNFKAIDPTYKGKGMDAYSRLDKEVFDEFSSNLDLLRKLAGMIKQVANDPEASTAITKIEDDEMSEDDSILEGQVLYKLHKVRERNKKLIDRKKKQVLKEKGALCCEACGFDFAKKYGAMGLGFIECHHLIPLASYQTIKGTRLEDLAVLCSNCHRMIHRNLSVTTILEFKSRWTNS